jgi:hypothetical protein
MCLPAFRKNLEKIEQESGFPLAPELIFGHRYAIHN